MPGVDLDLDLPSLSDNMAIIVAKLVTALSAVEDDLAPQITSGELDLDTAVSLGGNALTNVGGVRLTGGESAVVGTLYIGDDELQIVTAAGTVQITADGALNLASVGAIVGDYGGSNPARVTYDDMSGEYRFTEDTGVYADLVADDLILHGAAGQIRFGIDAALTGSKTVLFKSLPTGSGLLAYKASDNAIIDAGSETLDGDIATTGYLTGGYLISTGNLAVAGDAAIVGTANIANVLAQTDYKHSYQKSKAVPLGSGTAVNVSFLSGGSIAEYAEATSVGSARWRLDLDAGDRLQSVVIQYFKAVASTSDLTFAVLLEDRSGLPTTFSTVQSHAITGAGSGAAATYTLTLSSPAALTATKSNFFDVVLPRAGDTVYNVTYYWDHP